MLGGVPIGVIIPPRLAPTGIASARAMRPLPSAGKDFNTGVRNASIMAAVAVLLTNAEKIAVTRMKPSRTTSERVPKGLRSTRARATSSFTFVKPIASTKPPMKSMMVGLEKHAKMLLNGTRPTPFSGRRKLNALVETVNNITVTTIIEVTHDGIVSVSHMRAANTNRAMMRWCISVSPSIPNDSVGTRATTNEIATIKINLIALRGNFLSLLWDLFFWIFSSTLYPGKFLNITL